MAQETKVTLRANILDETREFDISHAEKILKENPGTDGYWELSDDKFTLNANGTIEHRGPKETNRPQKQKPDPQSDSA